jgi:hypothetical protein
MKEIRKQKKKRRKENKNTKRAPGKPFGPVPEKGHGPPGQLPNRYTLPSLTLIDSGPRPSVILFLRPETTPETVSSLITPLFNTLYFLP